MKYIKANQENVDKALVAALLMQHEWIICATSENPDDPSTYILENVTRYEIEGHFATLMEKPVFIEYGISPAKNDSKYQYRIHDSLMTPITNGKQLMDLIQGMVDLFDVFIIEDHMVDRYNVYGKLMTDHMEEIVFENEF